MQRFDKLQSCVRSDICPLLFRIMKQLIGNWYRKLQWIGWFFLETEAFSSFSETFTTASFDPSLFFFHRCLLQNCSALRRRKSQSITVKKLCKLLAGEESFASDGFLHFRWLLELEVPFVCDDTFQALTCFSHSLSFIDSRRKIALVLVSLCL